VVGLVDTPLAFLDAIRAALEADPLLPTALAKVVPIELVVRFEVSQAVETIAAAAEPLLERLRGRSFFVRLERRGLKGRLHSPTVERSLGDRVWQALEARGGAPRVDFRDPDAVLVVETIGEQAGLTVITRELRQAYPFVKIR
jgi:tRNA(Ser,Leu) C12 N-acetylase TAN1